MPSFTGLLRAALATAVLLSAGAAQAATYFAEVAVGNRSLARSSDDRIRTQLNSPRGGRAIAQSGDLALTSRAETELNLLHSAAAGWQETYRIDGSGTDLVPLILTALVSLRGEGRFETGAAFDLVQDGEDLLDLDYALARPRAQRIISRRTTVRRTIWIEPNVDFVFTLEAYADARRGRGYATISKPRLRLAADYRDDYRLIPSPGAPPAGAVPEPATWALLLLGFGSLGAILRRHHLTGSTRIVQELAA